MPRSLRAFVNDQYFTKRDAHYYSILFWIRDQLLQHKEEISMYYCPSYLGKIQEFLKVLFPGKNEYGQSIDQDLFWVKKIGEKKNFDEYFDAFIEGMNKEVCEKIQKKLDSLENKK